MGDRFNRVEDVQFYTKEWNGERFPDGRPKVSDKVLERLSKLTMEQAVMAMIDIGYTHQFEGSLKRTNSERRMIGRAVTAVMVPTRIDVHKNLLEEGRSLYGHQGFFNQWAIESLSEHDILVVDMCDQILYGTYVGGNLSTAIKTKTIDGGAVIWGGIRDLEQIEGIDDYQCYYRGYDPTPIGDVMMTGKNVPTRIGHAVCLPGDVVLGTQAGVCFIPAHLADYVASTAEKEYIRDIFGFTRLKDGTYTTDEVDNKWTIKIMKDFEQWFKTASEAKDYQYLDFSLEWEIAEKLERGEVVPFDGLVDYKYK